MTTQELYEKLHIINEDEQFYKRYYDVHTNKWQLDKFLNELNLEEINQRRLIVTDVDTGYMPSTMEDSTYFDISEKNSIVVSKHNRYTPAFHHKHVFFELAYVVEGSCTHEIDGETITLKQGEFLLIAPNVKHSISVFDASIILNILIRRGTFEEIFYEILCGTDIISVFFNQSLFSRTKNNYLILDTDQDPELLEHVLNMFLEYIGKERHYETILSSQTLILFSKILRCYEGRIRFPSTTLKSDENCMQIVGYIHENYQTVTLSEIADKFHFSQSYCSRIIKECTGLSFTDNVQNIRFNRACALLRTSDISIANIAHIVGFEHTEHFNRSFKSRFHMTPNAYRKTYTV